MKIVIIPIGPPGSGKTTLGTSLKKSFFQNENTQLFYTNRDDSYAQLRKNNGSNKTRRLLFDQLEEFYDKVNTSTSNSIVYIDSCNSKKGSRDRIIERIDCGHIIYLNFFYDVDTLLERVSERSAHPTFPTERVEQLNIIQKVVSGMEYEVRLENVCKIDFYKTATLQEKYDIVLGRVRELLWNC